MFSKILRYNYIYYLDIPRTITYLQIDQPISLLKEMGLLYMGLSNLCYLSSSLMVELIANDGEWSQEFFISTNKTKLLRWLIYVEQKNDLL